MNVRTNANLDAAVFGNHRNIYTRICDASLKSLVDTPPISFRFFVLLLFISPKFISVQFANPNNKTSRFVQSFFCPVPFFPSHYSFVGVVVVCLSVYVCSHFLPVFFPHFLLLLVNFANPETIKPRRTRLFISTSQFLNYTFHLSAVIHQEIVVQTEQNRSVTSRKLNFQIVYKDRWIVTYLSRTSRK